MTDKCSDSMVIAVGETLSNVFDAWEKRANESQEGFEEVRTLVNLDQDGLAKGKHEYVVNRKYWREHPTFKTYELFEKGDPASYWFAGIEHKK